jgi:hypothetical protein
MAASEVREGLYQSVSIQTSCCPECGRTYVSGGETKTVTAEKPNNNPEQGRLLDLFA